MIITCTHCQQLIVVCIYAEDKVELSIQCPTCHRVYTITTRGNAEDHPPAPEPSRDIPESLGEDEEDEPGSNWFLQNLHELGESTGMQICQVGHDGKHRSIIDLDRNPEDNQKMARSSFMEKFAATSHPIYKSNTAPRPKWGKRNPKS